MSYGYRWNEVPFESLLGMTLIDVEVKSSEEIVFTTFSGQKFGMVHLQDCCESVEIDDICGDFNDLLGEPILVAEEVSNSDDPPKGEYDESWTWTFYKLRTRKGDVTIRWYGTSNGYYSENVSLIRIPKEED